MNIERAHRACNVQMVLDAAGITTDDLIDQLLSGYIIARRAIVSSTIERAQEWVKL